MQKIKCDNCRQIFRVDSEKQNAAKGLRCPHCLSNVASNVKSFSDYVAGSKALSHVSKSALERRQETSKTARLIWSIVGGIFLFTCVILIILMLVTGYPFMGPPEFSASN